MSNRKTEDTKSNISQLLSSFNNFNLLLSNTTWVKTAKVEDIKAVFKLGSFIENASNSLSSQNTLEEFVNLHLCYNGIKENSNCDYHHACNYLLKIFFRYESISEETLDIAIRIYTSMFTKDRLQQVLSELILSSSNLEYLAQFMDVLPKASVKELEYHLYLCNWSDLCNTKKESVKTDLKEVLNVYELNNNFKCLLGILSLKNINESEKQVQLLILEIVLEKMQDRSILSKSFWYALFQQINLDMLCQICENFEHFLKSLFTFIIYLGTLMYRDGDCWKSNPNTSLCPDINFYELFIIIKSISKLNREFVLNKLSEAKNDTESDIWDHIKAEILVL